MNRASWVLEDLTIEREYKAKFETVEEGKSCQPIPIHNYSEYSGFILFGKTLHSPNIGIGLAAA